MIRPALLALALATSLAAPATAAPPDMAGTILAANRRAVVGEAGAPPTGSIVARYTYSGQGLRGTTETIAELATGAFVDSYRIDPTSGASGFDGRTPWMTDMSGTHTPEEGGDKPALAVNEAYRLANLWWRADRGGAAIALAGRDAEGERLRVTPRGGKPFEAWFDPRSHQLVHIREVQGFQTFDTYYSAFAPRGRLNVPTRIRIEDGNGPSTTQTLTLTGFEVGPARPASAYAMPRGEPADWSIAGGAPSVTVPFRLLNNHIFVDATVDGKGPFPFIVDTGGHNIITPSTAAALKLGLQGTMPSAGVGEKTAEAGYTRVRSLGVGGLTLRDQTVLTLDFSPKPVEGLEIGGMLGFELLRRFVVRFDYGARTMTLIDPAHFRPDDALAGGGVAMPFRFYDHLPQVEGRFGAIPGRFDIDTGSRSELTLTAPFVTAHKLCAALPGGIVTVDGWGVGGPARSYVTRASSLSLGGVTVPDVVTGMSVQTKGSFSDVNYEGNVGSGFLKRFVVTIDYGGRRLYLKPLAAPSPDTGTFDRAGMWINLGARGFDIVEITPGGPAAEAGLAKGDVLTAIDGQATTGGDSALADARRFFRTAPPGKVVTLDYLRGDKAEKATLTPRDQIAPAAATR